jgi:hypothetical protein
MLPDLILVQRDGKAIESGTHDAPLSQGRFYARLVDHQMAGMAAQVFRPQLCSAKGFFEGDEHG